MSTGVGPTPMELLAAAELEDGYRVACEASALNSIARRDQTYAPSFLQEDVARKLLHQVDSIPLLSDCNIIILNSTADNGYPHTRPGRIVCMPRDSVQGKPISELAETLRHEAMHVHQRENIPLWTASAMRDGWHPCPPGQIPLRMRERCRLNPDTFKPQQFWAWGGRYVPLPLFIRDDYPTLADIQIRWYDLQTQTTYSSPPSTFERRYGARPSQPEHPFELLAVEAASANIIDAATLEKWLNQLDGQRGP